MDSNVLFLKYEDMHRVSVPAAAADGRCPGPAGTWAGAARGRVARRLREAPGVFLPEQEKQSNGLTGFAATQHLSICW